MIKITTLFLFSGMKVINIIILLFFVVVLKSQTLITSVNVIDVTSGEIAYNQHVLISDDKISEISDDIQSHASWTIIDGHNKWLIPGLVDAHIHMFQSGGLYTRPDALDLRDIRPYDEEISWLYDHASDIFDAYLNLGITSVMDVGGPMTNYLIRDQADTIVSPDYYCTGPLLSTYQPEAFRIEDPPIIKVDSPDEAKALVEAQLAHNPNLMKIWYINIPGPTNNRDIVKTIISESHAHDIPVAVHATDNLTAGIAVQEGADILVHSVAQTMDDDFIQMIAQKGVVLIPTLVVHGGYDKAFLGEVEITSHDLDNGVPQAISDLLDQRHISHPDMEEAKAYAPEFIARNKVRDSIRTSNLRRLVDAGAIIASGTDAGNIGTLHATSYMAELLAMKRAGLSNLEVIKASTLGGAKAMQRSHSHGEVKKGKHADLILLNNNPLDDINHLSDIAEVIKDGEIVDRQNLSERSPEELVQMQLNAYNLGNIESFLFPYSDSVKVYGFPNQLRYEGIDRMREGYQSFFEQTPDLHCELINRIVLGNTVIDQEEVTGLANGGVIKAIAIYKIWDGKIQKVYFDRGQ